MRQGVSVQRLRLALEGDLSQGNFLVPSQWFFGMYRGRNSDGRTPFLSRLDLYLQHRFRLTDKVGLTLSANVINLFQSSHGDELLSV